MISNTEPRGVPIDEATATDYMQVRAALVRRFDGNASDALVWTRINYRVNGPYRLEYEHDGVKWWRCSREDLADETGLSADQVRRALERLEKSGYIEAAQHAVEGRYDRTKSYRCLTHLATEPNQELAGEPNPDRAAEPNPPIRQEDKELDLEHSDRAELEIYGVAEALELTNEIVSFEVLYQVYPRHDGKQAAERAYEKARKKIKPRDLLAAVELWSWHASCAIEAKTTQVNFLPQFSKWLNQGMWADDPTDRFPVVAARTTSYDSPADRARGVMEIGRRLAAEDEQKGIES